VFQRLTERQAVNIRTLRTTGTIMASRQSAQAALSGVNAQACSKKVMMRR
jgi:hypothetical protein